MDSPKTDSSPFKDCPVDILRIIFEAAVSRDEAGFETATIISHVSHYWRIVALSTPLIWTYVSFSMLRQFDDTMEFLKWTHERIGTRAVLLVVKDISWDQISILGSFELKRIPNLEWLKLNFSGAPPGEWTSLSKALNRPNIDLTRLDLRIEPNYLWRYDLQTGKFGGFPPNLKYLNITNGYFINLEFTESYPTIQHLFFRGVRFTLINIVQCFPNLETLEMNDSFVGHVVDEFQISDLKKLKIYRPRSIEWLRSLSCPALTELCFKEISELEKIIAFIKRHGSITTLKANHPNITPKFLYSAPQLQHLTTRNIGNKFYHPPLGSKTQLPHLKTLTISDFDFQLLKEQFEELALARCLPAHHPKSRLLEGCTPLDTLGVMLLQMNKLEDTNWAESELLEEARVWVESDGRWSDRKRVCMSWSGHGPNTVS